MKLGQLFTHSIFAVILGGVASATTRDRLTGDTALKVAASTMQRSRISGQRIDGYTRTIGRFRIKLDLQRNFTGVPGSFFQGQANFLGNDSAGDLPVSVARYAGRTKIFLLNAPGTRRKTERMFELSFSGAGEKLRVRRIRPKAGACGNFSGFKTAAARSTNTSDDRLRTFKVMELIAVGDREWGQALGSSASSAMAAAINGSEAIYERQLGVTYDVKSITVLGSSPYTSSDPVDLVEQLAAHKPAGSADLYHLFTAKNLGVLGIAYDLGTICRTPGQSVSITVHEDAAEDLLTFAHESGHNFGAQHDEGEPPSIMYPGPAEGISQFSAFSINEMSDHIASYGNCLGSKTGPGPVNPPTEPDPVAPEGIELWAFKENYVGLQVLTVFSHKDFDPLPGEKVELLRRTRRRPQQQVIAIDTTDSEGYLSYDIRRAGYYQFRIPGRPNGVSQEIRLRRIRN